MLNSVEWINDINSVQDLWNDIESKIVSIADIIVSLVAFVNNIAPPRIPPHIMSKIYKRNKLLKLRKRQPSNELKARIGSLNPLHEVIQK